MFRPERWLEEESTDGENKMEQYFFTVSASDMCLAFGTKYGSCRRVCSDWLEYTNASPLSRRSSLCTITYPLTKQMSNLDSTYSVKVKENAQRKTR